MPKAEQPYESNFGFVLTKAKRALAALPPDTPWSNAVQQIAEEITSAGKAFRPGHQPYTCSRRTAMEAAFLVCERIEFRFGRDFVAWYFGLEGKQPMATLDLTKY